MKNTLIVNIKQLLLADRKPKNFISGNKMDKIPIINNAFLYVEGNRIKDFGKMEELHKHESRLYSMVDKIIDANDRVVLPGWCDSHTHLVFAGSREKEFVDRIKGLTYEEIAKRGGGIINSVYKLRETSEDELYQQSLQRLIEIGKLGTVAVEIKSGYGLDTESELKILRVIKRLKNETPIKIKSTFMGAHAIPPEYKNNPDEYVELLVNEMIPLVASEDLADFIDVFCENGFFSIEQTERILMAGIKYGLRPKLHANQLSHSGGIEIGVKYNALSVDHIEYITDEDIELLKNSDTMPTVLPGAAFFLDLPLTPTRKLIENDLPIAAASDYNPGSSPSGNMNFIVSLLCIKYKLTPSEAIIATTLNSAYAMHVEALLGTITPGKIASFIITKPIPSYEFIPYSYGNHVIEKVFINGELFIDYEK
ncbi:MAG: imidazolonepropionase [Bacteroidales bacterium]|nr:imidazolonepropionase [Bacteroidales bacterium]